ncbi:MAG: hypothetical protein FWH01_08690 [Oscillospiraceae bacterium]|nr:hypothetical protein [Oscillospiraceae bacterium]
MMFRSAMCPNCDSFIKLDSESESIYCAKCGIQMQAQDAFVYYELKTGGKPDIGAIGSYSILLKCGTGFLEQQKHDLADACFANILKNAPDDYQIWKLRALTWESQVVNEYKKSFYEFSRKNGLVENKEYIEKYREYCDNAVRHSPGEISDELAEEFNDHIRGHFNIAYRAYKLEKRRSTTFTALTAASMLALVALALNACRM